MTAGPLRETRPVDQRSFARLHGPVIKLTLSRVVVMEGNVTFRLSTDRFPLGRLRRDRLTLSQTSRVTKPTLQPFTHGAMHAAILRTADPPGDGRTKTAGRRED